MVSDLSQRREVLATDPFDALPGHLGFDQKLRLFGRLHVRLRPVALIDDVPPDMIKLCDTSEILKHIGTGIRRRERPATSVRLCILTNGMQIELQRHDRALSVRIDETWIPSGDDVKHHRSRAEIERHAGTYSEPRTTANLVDQPPILNVLVANPSPGEPLLPDGSIRQERASRDDRRKAIVMHDVVELGLRGDGRHSSALDSDQHEGFPDDHVTAPLRALT